MTATVAEIGDLTKQLNGETAPKLQTTIVELQKTLVEVQRSLGKDSPLNYKATKAMEELSETLEAIRELAQTLDHQPQSLLFGKGSKTDE